MRVNLVRHLAKFKANRDNLSCRGEHTFSIVSSTFNHGAVL
jgi:hypothetical protein